MRRSFVVAVTAVVVFVLAPWAGAQVYDPRPPETRRSEKRAPDAGKIQALKAAWVSYEKASEHLREQDLDRAAKELQACLKLDPDFSEAHFLYAKVEYLRERFPEALERILRAEASYEASREAFLELQARYLGEVQRLKDQEEARLAANRRQLQATESAREQLELVDWVTEGERDSVEYQRLLVEHAAVPAGIPARYHFFHGNILLRLERFDEAATFYRRALETDPAHGDASNNLASIYLSARQPGTALAVLDKAEAAGAAVNPELRQAVLAAQVR